MSKRRSDGATKRRRAARPASPPRRRGFTLVELVVAGVLTAMVLGTLSTTIGQLSRAKATCKERLDAHLRADMAMNQMRRDIASIIRADDLFYTRFLLLDDNVNSVIGELPRDEMVVFTTHLRPIRSLDFNGEGSEYETQYRVDEQSGVPVLWQRRDAYPDDYPLAGGQASPLVEQIVGLEIEAYDGDSWYDTWDSDFDGIPHAVRITVTASGARPEQSAYEAVTVSMRTIVAIDRLAPPIELVALTEEELEELDARVLIDPALAGTGTDTDDPTRDGDQTDGGGGDGMGDDGRDGGGGGGGGRGDGGGGGGGSRDVSPFDSPDRTSGPDRNISPDNPPS